MAVLITAIAGFLQLQTVYAVNSLEISTSSGPVTGAIADEAPHVAQFLGIPYSEQPVGERRWLPPTDVKRQENIDATTFGPSCPQFEGNGSSVWRNDAPEFVTPADTYGEACLSVNIWTPWSEQECEEKLPVIVWLYGGAFEVGAASVPYQNPSRWIERSQEHIVVAINYRVNIFGFPNAAGLEDDEQNLGLLDQRFAMEWIRANIANFGGDPNRITLWGQSAGAFSVDFYNFAYPNNSFVTGLMMNSGTALVGLASDDPEHTNFTFTASHFGCANLSASAELDCFRKVNMTSILDYLKQRNDAGTTPALSFTPVVDNRTTFANYTERTLAGKYTKKPAIIGTVANEGGPFLPYDPINGPNQTLADSFTLNFFCPAVQTTRNRYATCPTGENSPATYRYLYAGNFSNIAPLWWEGAYHSSELPLIFGTHDIARTPSTSFEYAVSEQMQDYWLAFAKDPENGLPKLGWEAYRPGGEGVLIGYEGVVSQGIAEERLEAPCDGAMGRPGASPPP